MGLWVSQSTSARGILLMQEIILLQVILQSGRTLEMEYYSEAVDLRKKVFLPDMKMLKKKQQVLGLIRDRKELNNYKRVKNISWVPDSLFRLCLELLMI